MFLLPRIKKLLRSRRNIVIAIAASFVLLTGTSFAIYSVNKEGTPEASSTTKQVTERPASKKSAAALITESEAAPAETAGTPKPSPSAVPNAAKPKPTPPVNTYKPSLCDQKRPEYYSAYYVALNSENQKHQQILNELKADYDEGVYEEGYEDSFSAQPYNDYQNDVKAENERWHAATGVIYDNYTAQLRAVGCPV